MGRKKKDVVEAETPTTESKTDAAPTLLWNERGQIGCTLPGHAPFKGTDTWKFEHWKKIPPGTLSEDGKPFRCESCSAGERSPAGATDAADATPPVEAEPEAPKKKGKKAKADLALTTFFEHFLTHFAESGKSAGTCFSYRLELKTATDALGAETKLGDLTSEQVAAYFGSDRVLKTRSGREKSPLSIAKTMRVLRLALVWAQEKGWIEKAPLPENLATH